MVGVFKIAEIGANFAYGQSKDEFMNNIYGLIDKAVEAGFDCVKFQCRTPEVSTPGHMRDVPKKVPWNHIHISYLEYRKDVELTKKQYKKINAYCIVKDIKWGVSVWDEQAVDFISEFEDLAFIKIPSAKITDLSLLEKVNLMDCDVIISTGMSFETEIKKAIDVFRNHNGKLSILHCNSSYPTSNNELDLNYITVLKEEYPQYSVGFSSHSTSLYASITAVALGAEVIEVHFTTSRLYFGSDQKSSLVVDECILMNSVIDMVPIFLGNKKKTVYESEFKKRRELRG